MPSGGMFDIVFYKDRTDELLSIMNRLVSDNAENKLFTYDGHRYFDGPEINSDYAMIESAFCDWGITCRITESNIVLAYSLNIADTKAVLWLITNIAPVVLHGVYLVNHNDGLSERYIIAHGRVLYQKSHTSWTDDRWLDRDGMVKLHSQIKVSSEERSK